jgi:hypothetical protein
MFHLENLNDEHWALLRELVEAELNELPVETRRTDNAEMREALHRRMKTAQELLARMHEMVAA